MTNNIRTFLIGAAAGVSLTVLATDALPRMMAQMMQKMMNQMGPEGGPPDM